MNKSVIVLFSVIITIFSSCSTMKKKPNRKNVTVDSTTSTVVPADSASPVVTNQQADTPIMAPTEPVALSAEKQELVNQLLPLWNKWIDYKTFKGKAKVHYEGSGMKHDLTANFRMAKDSVIWVHVSAGMGLVNVARIFVTPDSLLLVNYLDKSVIRMTSAEAKEKLPAAVDFKLLQSLVIGETLSKDGKPTDATDFGSTWTLDMTSAEAKQQANYNKSDSTMRTLQVLSSLGGGLAGMIQFGNYQKVSNRNFALSRAINVQNKGEQHYLDMTFNNASFDEKLDFPLSIPADYLNK